MTDITSSNFSSLAFQWVIDNAESIRINKRGVVAQTTARDGTVRAVTRGGAVWRFSVKMPDGFRYSDVRGYLEALDRTDRLYGNVAVDLNNAGSSWLSAYQGEMTAPQIANLTATIATTTTLTVGTLPTMSSTAYLFRAGDMIQLKNTGASTRRDPVYSVAYDVLRGAGSTVTITVNRPILTVSASTFNLYVGNDVVFKTICASMPDYTVTPNQLVVWNGNFDFVEDINTDRIVV